MGLMREECKARKEWIELDLGAGNYYIVPIHRCQQHGTHDEAEQITNQKRCVATKQDELEHIGIVGEDIVVSKPYFNHTECEIKTICRRNSLLETLDTVVDFACPFRFRMNEDCVCVPESQTLSDCTNSHDAGGTVKVGVFVISLVVEFVLVVLVVYLYSIREKIFTCELLQRFQTRAGEVCRQVSTNIGTTIGFHSSFDPQRFESEDTPRSNQQTL